MIDGFLLWLKFGQRTFRNSGVRLLHSIGHLCRRLLHLAQLFGSLLSHLWNRGRVLRDDRASLSHSGLKFLNHYRKIISNFDKFMAGCNHRISIRAPLSNLALCVSYSDGRQQLIQFHDQFVVDAGFAESLHSQLKTALYDIPLPRMIDMRMNLLRPPAFHAQQRLQHIAGEDQLVTSFQRAIGRSDFQQVVGDFGILRCNRAMLIQ